MQDLLEIYEAKPGSNKVLLEYKYIKDIAPLIPVLEKMPKLDQLSFHGNQIKFLPPMDGLMSVRRLDLSNNPLKVPL